MMLKINIEQSEPYPGHPGNRYVNPEQLVYQRAEKETFEHSTWDSISSCISLHPSHIAFDLMLQ